MRVGATAGSDAMLEEICTHRARLGGVVVMYTPGHRGISPNEYADAVAKAHVWDDVDPLITSEIAKHVCTRPCVYRLDGVGEGLSELVALTSHAHLQMRYKAGMT
jgi:hypothetical protein